DFGKTTEYHGLQARHFRRYRAADLVSRLEKIGFKILDRSHLGFLVFPAFWAMKKWNRSQGHLEPEKRKEIIVKDIRTSGDIPLMHHVMAVEGWLRSWVYLPFGIRCIITCRRP